MCDACNEQFAVDTWGETPPWEEPRWPCDACGVLLRAAECVLVARSGTVVRTCGPCATVAR